MSYSVAVLDSDDAVIASLCWWREGGGVTACNFHLISFDYGDTIINAVSCSVGVLDCCRGNVLCVFIVIPDDAVISLLCWWREAVGVRACNFHLISFDFGDTIIRAISCSVGVLDCFRGHVLYWFIVISDDAVMSSLYWWRDGGGVRGCNFNLI